MSYTENAIKMMSASVPAEQAVSDQPCTNTIIFELRKQFIRRVDAATVASGSKNYLKARFETPLNDWCKPITAIFDSYTVLLDENNECFIPWEALSAPHTMAVSAFSADLHTAIVTPVVIEPSGYISGETPEQPTSDVYQQLIDIAKNAENVANSVREDADAGMFNGAIGPEGPAGQDAPQIDDTQASPDHPWSGFKSDEEIAKVQDQVDFILGKNAPSTFDEIRFAVEQGRDGQYFSVGDQLKTNWSDGDTAYEDPFDVVQLGRTYELENGSVIKGMMIQQHYANVESCPFDAQESLFDADEELPAGTYHITVAGDTWLPNENGKVLQFTLTQPIPAGGQLVYAISDGYNQALAGQSISTFASPTSFDPIETVVLAEGSEGTDLGVTDGKGNLNHHQRAFRGCGRWKTSMLRQYLNSDKPAGEWWTKQDKWDRASTFINSCAGYLAGFDADFLAIIKPVKVQTARDTVVYDGGTDVTYDMFFPISLEQLNAAPQISGVEGSALDYWKAVAAADTTGNLDSNGRFKQHGTYPDLRVYGLNAKTTARKCWLRSAFRGNSSTAWYVYTSGYVGGGSTDLYSQYCAPACVIG